MIVLAWFVLVGFIVLVGFAVVIATFIHWYREKRKVWDTTANSASAE